MMSLLSTSVNLKMSLPCEEEKKNCVQKVGDLYVLTYSDDVSGGRFEMYICSVCFRTMKGSLYVYSLSRGFKNVVVR